MLQVPGVVTFMRMQLDLRRLLSMRREVCRQMGLSWQMLIDPKYFSQSFQFMQKLPSLGFSSTSKRFLSSGVHSRDSNDHAPFHTVCPQGFLSFNSVSLPTLCRLSSEQAWLPTSPSWFSAVFPMRERVSLPEVPRMKPFSLASKIRRSVASRSEVLSVMISWGAPVSKKKDSCIFPLSIARQLPKALAKAFSSSITQISLALGLAQSTWLFWQGNLSSVLTIRHSPSMKSRTPQQCAGLTSNRNFSERSSGQVAASEETALMKQQSPTEPCLMSLASMNCATSFLPRLRLMAEAVMPISSYLCSLKIQFAQTQFPDVSGFSGSRQTLLLLSMRSSSSMKASSSVEGTPMRQQSLARGKSARQPSKYCFSSITLSTGCCFLSSTGSFGSGQGCGCICGSSFFLMLMRIFLLFLRSSTVGKSNSSGLVTFRLGIFRLFVLEVGGLFLMVRSLGI